jgi:hypothetical protein
LNFSARMMKVSLLLLTGCWTSSQTTTSQPGTPDVSVQLAAVTLGDDCGDAPTLPAPVMKPAPNRRAPAGAPMPPASMAPCAPDQQNCSLSHRSHCDQTSMQISLRATDGAGSTNVRVKKVELLDPRGKLLAELESRTPAKWNGSSYVTWNQQIGANETLATTYVLSAPDWNKLTDGRWNAHSKTFQLRVTLVVGSSDRTVEKQSITPAMVEPAVPT